MRMSEAAVAYCKSRATRRPRFWLLTEPCQVRPSNSRASPFVMSGCTRAAVWSWACAPDSIDSAVARSRRSPRCCRNSCTVSPRRCDPEITCSAESRVVRSMPIQAVTKPPAGLLDSMSLCQGWATPGARLTALAPHKINCGRGWP